MKNSRKDPPKSPEKPAVEKPAAKKTAARKTTTRKSAKPKTAAKKTTAKKTAPKKAAPKKAATRKTAAKKAATPRKRVTTEPTRPSTDSLAKAEKKARPAKRGTTEPARPSGRGRAETAPPPPPRPEESAAEATARRAEETARAEAFAGSRRHRVSRDQIRLEFEQRPLLEPPYEVPPSVPEPGGAPRRVAFVLHAHLPWVLGHGTWPHGEDWLAEAVTHCYLPLLDAFRRLAGKGRRQFVTMSVTPVLAAMFADRRTPALVDRYLTERTKTAWESRGVHPLGIWWHGELERLRGIWDSFDHDLIGALRELSDRGAIELSTSAGTHVYLPLAHTQKLVRLALRAGRESHRELFESDPRGVWMPECAYRPGGPWQHPTTGATEEFRPGNEQFLEEQGLQWTVVDAHLLRKGDPAFPYLSDLPPEEVVEPGGPHPKPYWMRRSAVAAFLRDARSAAQVWSRQGGYPGDGAFLDFHKRHWPSGLRFWRVTGAEVDLGDKLAYWPDEAAGRAREQAEHFVELVGTLEGMSGGVVCAPFDAELFGHWWFEGPVWLERVLELAAPGQKVEATTPARELDAGPSLRRAFFAEGSWGAGGDHRVWVNPATDWIWHELADLERRAFAAVRWRGGRKWRRAILNQLLLAAASDWPFLVTMETGRDYAEARFRVHAARLRELIELGPRARVLPAWVDDDLPFPEIEPEWSLPPEE